MTATIISLLAVTVAFGALLGWVFWPGNRQRLEAHGRIPLEDHDAGTAPSTERTPNQ